MTHRTDVQDLDEKGLIDKLKTGHDGLTASEARSRLSRDGPNILKSEAKKSVVSLFLKQFKSSLIYLLLAAGLLSFALKDVSDGTVITVILVINTGLGFYQELKSKNAIESLQRLVSKEILVKRDGGRQTLINEHALVEGDLVVLREGDIVPADIKLVKVNNLSVNEAQLTGESLPVTKTTDGKRSLVFAGSTIEKGEAEGFIYATASHTELGKIAHLSTGTKRITQYEQSLSTFSSFLVKLTLSTLSILFVFKLLIGGSHTHITTLLLFIIALSIAVVPEAMPVIATVTLSSGALKLAKRHVIAKTLSAVEDLGNISILCSDKTGTLTMNNQTVKKCFADDQKLFEKLAIASLEMVDEKRKRSQSSFDRAFIKFVPDDIREAAAGYRRLADLPFDPAARRRRVVFSDGKKDYLVAIGSVETLLDLTKCKHEKAYLKVIKEDGTIGLRHLAIAYKEVKYTDSFDILKNEKDLAFVGFVALEDPLRPTAKRTIKVAEELGVSLKILSGDSREVTHYVASEVGLAAPNQTVYIGDEIDAMSDSHLSEVLKTNNAFARLNPEQKYRIIKLLKLHGNVVGYQGDGINDAPALKLADVAIAVNNATDVAQDSADILLLRNDIEVIINGIEYGRGIFSNINKYIRYTMIGNFGNFFALGTLYLLSASLPLLTIQLLLTNLLGDVPLVAISTDNIDIDEIKRPSKYDIHQLMYVSMLLGSFTALFILLFYAVVKSQPISLERTALYLYLTLLGVVVIFCVRNKGHFWKAPKLSRTLTWSFAFISVLSAVIIYIPATAHYFHFYDLSLRTIGLILAMCGFYLLFMDTIKVWLFKTTHSLSS